MPITTILQHQRDKEKLDQPNLGTPMAEDDRNVRNKDTIKEVRLFWALAMERYVGISLLTKEEKAAAVAGRWAAPGSTYQSKLLNGPESGCPNVDKLSTKGVFSGSCKAKQTNSNHLITNGETATRPRATPFDSQSPTQESTVNYDSRRASCGMQQNTQLSRKNNEPRQNFPSEHHGSPPSPTDSVYEVARRAVNFLDIHKAQDTEPSINDARQLAPNTHTREQTTPRRCNSMETSPTSHSSAQTSPLSHNGSEATPIRWSTIRTYPSCRDAIVFSDRKREREMVSGQQRTSSQRRRSQPSNGQRLQSAAARRRAMLKHSVTYTLPAANLQTTPAAPEPPVISQSRMSSNQLHSPRPVVGSQSTSTSRQATPLQSVMTLRPGATPYPRLMPRPPAASQRMANPQPPAKWQPTYTQRIYPQSTNSQCRSSQTHYVQPAYPESTHSRSYYSHPECAQTYRSQPTYSQPMAVPQQANNLHPAITSRPLSASRTVGVSQGMTASQPPVTSQQATTVAKEILETNRERGRRLRREHQLRKEASLLRKDSPPLHDPPESTIVGMLPSVGNKVVEHLIKYNPSAVAASKLSHAIPKKTAVHYNSVLTWHVQNVQATEYPSPHGHSTHFDDAESRTASSDEVPAVREAQTMAPIVVPIRSMPVSQQSVNAENHHHHSHSNTLAPQHGVQSHPYSRVPSEELDNASSGYCNYSSVSKQQSTYEQRERRLRDDCPSDIQEISRMDWQAANQGNPGRQTDIQVAIRQDWQAANKDSPRYRIGQSSQAVVVSASYERTMASSTSASSVNPQGIPKPCVKKSEDMMLPMSPQRPIRQNPVSTSAQAQAQAQTVKKPANQANPISGGIHKRKFSRAGRNSPPQSTASRITISQLIQSSPKVPKTVVPQIAVRRIAISQLVLPSTVPRVAISQLVQSSTGVPQTAVPRIAISQLVLSSTEVPKSVESQTAVPQATMPQTAPPAVLPSSRPDKQRCVRLSGSGMWLTQDDVDRWQEERKNPYCLPSFKDSFGDVSMTNCPASYEKQTSSEPAGGLFSLDGYRINPVTSCPRNWFGIVNN